MVQSLVPVGPEDLYHTLEVLSPNPKPLPWAMEALRASLDEPLEALLLAEKVGLCQQVGLDLALTPEGQAWLNTPWEPPAALLLFLLQTLPWPEALERLKSQGNTLPLMALLSLFPNGPKGEKAARALAEWGALFGFWELLEDRIEGR